MKENEKPQAKGGLLRSASVVSGLTMVSRVLGLIRDMILANLFGAGGGIDAFFVAFRIPNFFRRLFAEGAFSQAFVPVLSEYRSKRDQASVQLLVSYTAGTLGGILLSLTLLCVLFAPVVTYVFAPGFHQLPDKFDLAAEMLRLTFPYLFFISMTAFLGSVLNSCGHFAAPAFAPVLLNIALISAALLVAPLFDIPIMALAWAVLFAGIIQLMFQLPFVNRYGLLVRPRWGWHDPGVRKIIKLMVPAMFGVSVAQINLLLDTVLASFLVDGSVSWLYYSDRLMELPLGVFGVAIGTVILPSLSRKHADKSAEHFSATLDWALRLVLIIGVPASLALLVLAGPVLTTLFQYGEFSGNDVLLSANSLRAYSLGLLAFMVIKVLAPGYFARQDTKTPVAIGIKAMAANMLFNLLLVFPLAHVGLALATSMSAALNAGLLFLGLRKAQVYQPQSGWWLFAGQLALASFLMVATLLLMQQDMELWLQWSWRERSLNLASLVGAGLGVYFVALWLFGLRPGHFKLNH